MERVVRSRNGFPLLLAAIGMVVLLASCGVTSNSAALGSAANPVPWISNPGTSQGSATVQATRACRAADLSVKAGRSGAFHGLATQEVLLTNRGQEACFLPGPPAAVVILNDGSRRQATVSSSAAVATRIDLAVGQIATLLLGTPGTCPGAGHPQVGPRVELTLATGEKLSVSNTWVNVECGSPAVVEFIAGPVSVASVPASNLSVTISAPGSVARGDVLRYVITLTNPTSAPIRLSPCLSYTETLGTSPTPVVSQTYLLNCAAMPTISAGAAVVFAMSLSASSDIPSGVTKLSWSLQVPNSPSAGTTVQVT